MIEINGYTNLADLNVFSIKISKDFILTIDNLRKMKLLTEIPFSQMMKALDDLIDERVAENTHPLYRKFIELWVLDITEKDLKRKFENVIINA